MQKFLYSIRKYTKFVKNYQKGEKNMLHDRQYSIPVIYWEFMKKKDLCTYEQNTNISIADNLYTDSQILNCITIYYNFPCR